MNKELKLKKVKKIIPKLETVIIICKKKIEFQKQSTYSVSRIDV